MDETFGAPPKSGWAKMVLELHVEDLDASLGFWRDILGFAIAYRRPAEGFVYLERPEGHQIMLCRRNGRFETGPMDRPFGRGVMLQIYLDSLDASLSAIAAKGWPFHTPPREVWRRTGDIQSGQREFCVQDPDGYLAMVAQNIGIRPAPAGA